MRMIRTGLMMAVAMVAVAPRMAKAVPLTVIAEIEPQVKDDLFAGTEKFAQGATDVTDVNLDKNMLGMLNKHKDKDGKDGVAKKMEFIIVHSYTYDKPGMYKMEDVEIFRKKLQDGSWSCMIHTKDKDGTTDICTKSSDNGETSDLVVMTAEAKELTFVHLRGHGISLEDLAQTGYMGHRDHTAPPAPPATPAPRSLPAPAAPR